MQKFTIRKKASPNDLGDAFFFAITVLIIVVSSSFNHRVALFIERMMKLTMKISTIAPINAGNT